MLTGVLCSEWCVLLLHNVYEDTTIGQRYGKVEVAQATIQLTAGNDLQLVHILFVPVTLYFLRARQILARIALSAR